MVGSSEVIEWALALNLDSGVCGKVEVALISGPLPRTN